RWERTGATWSTVADIVIDLGQGDSVTLRQALNQDGAALGKIERVEFEDGTVWTDAELRARLLAGGAGDDSIQGWGEADRIEGGTGNDSLEGQGGDDLLAGGEGGDRLYGDEGNDRLQGGEGDDTLTDRAGDNILNGGAGHDTLATYGAGNNLLNGDEGDDILRSGMGSDLLDGGSGDDTLSAGGGNDTLRGGDGNDRLAGGLGSDVLEGGVGDDVLTGGNEPAVWSAGWAARTPNGNDTYRFGRGDGHDIVMDRDSLAGNTDTIELAADIVPADVQLTHVGNDLILSLTTGDTLTVANWFRDGGEWRDRLGGDSGGDLLQCGAGEDTLIGGAGGDVLHGFLSFEKSRRWWDGEYANGEWRMAA
ncbi:MAG: hypothetical protein HZB40_04745, partial [Rhodocyclales bacterium]|nr:hypothetical protein [Rhodocyclales bacterium]